MRIVVGMQERNGEAVHNNAVLISPDKGAQGVYRKVHPATEPGPLKSYEFHWTVGDYINAVVNAGCHVLFVDEYGEEVADWEGAPLHGLPESLLIVARKNVEQSAEPDAASRAR